MENVDIIRDLAYVRCNYIRPCYGCIESVKEELTKAELTPALVETTAIAIANVRGIYKGLPTNRDLNFALRLLVDIVPHIRLKAPSGINSG